MIMTALAHLRTSWSGLLLLALVSACRGRSPQAKPADARNDTSVAQTVIPPPELTAASKPQAEWVSWTLADTGFGPITIGMTPEQANSAVDGSLTLPKGLTTDACDYAVPRGLEGLAFMIEQGKVVRVEVRRPGIHTDQGASIGDSEARIYRLYSGHVRTSPHKYTAGHYLTVTPADTVAHPYRLIFETDGAVVKNFRGGVLPQVEYVEGCS
jgi:hypothetical protein